MGAKFIRKNGQAITELAICLLIFVLLLFGLDALGTLVMTKVRAETYQHHLTFKSYRQSESIEVGLAPHPDPLHLTLKPKEEGFSDRLWFQLKNAQVRLTMKVNFHLDPLPGHFQPIKSIPHYSETYIYRDPWNDHPIKYAIWALATAMALGRSSCRTAA